MKNFLTVFFVLFSVQAALANDNQNCRPLPAASLTCVIPVGVLEIKASAEKSCGAGRDATLTLVNNDGEKSEPVMAYDVEAIFRGEHAPLDVSYNTKKSDASTRIELNCARN